VGRFVNFSLQSFFGMCYTKNNQKWLTFHGVIQKNKGWGVLETLYTFYTTPPFREPNTEWCHSSVYLFVRPSGVRKSKKEGLETSNSVEIFSVTRVRAPFSGRNV